VLVTVILSSVGSVRETLLGATKVKWRNTGDNIYVSYVNKLRLGIFSAFCSRRIWHAALLILLILLVLRTA
jgi:hypothetical protein